MEELLEVAGKKLLALADSMRNNPYVSPQELLYKLKILALSINMEEERPDNMEEERPDNSDNFSPWRKRIPENAIHTLTMTF